MSTSGVKSLEQVIRECGVDSLLDDFSSSEEALRTISAQLRDANAAAQEILESDAPIISEQSLFDAFSTNRHKATAFLQAMRVFGDCKMLVMAWRVIMQGLQIAQLEIQYEIQTAFSMEITLRPSGRGNRDSETYTSDNIEDVNLLKHFGIMRHDDKPVFDGFYPLRARQFSEG